MQNNNFLGEARRNDAETFLEWPNAHVGDTAIRAILGIALLANRYLRSSLVAIVLFLLTDDYKSSWQKRTQHHTYES